MDEKVLYTVREFCIFYNGFNISESEQNKLLSFKTLMRIGKLFSLCYNINKFHSIANGFNIFFFVYIYIYIYVCVYVCMPVCTYVCICITLTKFY
jgi:hypothetical protein